ncbi:uncharacterized protein LOC123263497 isoform X2 [Cotesia glomerata]|uniref:uncharacterized protein LOC123263497 isoform X2 n=1 Tax=Cotesia glomerata TaxID=32391 RepID=UPI001D035887|nr:uncharacterized protein LOC123263497 isoform X2 [Cotesia glomerata]
MSPETNQQKICVFCNDPEDNEIKYGKIYQHNGIITHYYCLLLSSNMQQRGGDDDGILGFLPADINRELNRGKRLVCVFCKRKGATLGCVNKKCKRVFHLPCGLKNNTLHQFFDQFKSFCQSHRPKQHIDSTVLKSTPERTTCWICFDSASRQDVFKTLWAPCCKKNAWFHRDCVQQLALSAGYFFKCPLCNNKKEFQSAMQECGIFVPSQDASWELVPNAFQELLYRHNRCDAQECLCPQGRDYNSSTNSSWEMVLCRTCGSQGTHVRCTNLRWAKSWDCNDCVSILSKKFSETNTIINGTVTHDIDVSIDSDDEDSSSSVTKALELASINLKPGPRSAKLKQLHQTARQLPEPTTIQQLKSILDEQQAVQGSSDRQRNNSEEDEISILEVRKVTPQNSPEKILQAVKYPELSIEPRKSFPETSNQKQNDVSIFRSNDSQRLNSVPGTSVPGTAVPGTSVPETSVPGTSVSRTPVPGTFVPLASVPGTIVNGTFVPRTSVPGKVVPGTSVPGTSVLRTVVPETSIPRTSVPGTSVSGISVTRTWVPGPIVNGTSVPRTSIPGTIVNGTDVPRTIVPGTNSIQESSEGTARCRQDFLLNKSNQGSKSNKIIEDVIVVDSDDENDGTIAQPAEELASQSQIEAFNPEDGLMNIKILEVTSLAPEEFARVPDNSTNIVNDFEPVQNSETSFSTSESIISENSSGAFIKRKADSPSVLSTLVDRVNNVIDTNTRELMRASLPPKKPRYGPNISAPATTTDVNPTAPTMPTTPSVSNFATGMTRIVPPSNYMQNHVVSYAGGISLANSAVIKFCDKQYILPLGPPNNAATMSSGENGQQIPSDGDAGSEPASEFNLPASATPAAPATVTVKPVPEAHSSSPPPPSSPPATSTSTAARVTARKTSALETRVHSQSTSAADPGALSSTEVLSRISGHAKGPAISSSQPGESGAARTRVTKTKKHNPTTNDQHNDDCSRSDRFGVKGQKILLRDLKFRMCSNNSLEITAYNNYRMNIDLDSAINSDNGQRLRSGRNNVCIVKPRSSRVRGPKSKRMKYENISSSINNNNNPDDNNLLTNDSASDRIKGDKSAESSTVVTPNSGSSSYNYHQTTDTAKENLKPINNDANLNGDFNGRKLRSSKCLGDIDHQNSDNINNNNDVENSEINFVNNEEITNENCQDLSSEIQDGGMSCHVSIDLNRIKSLIDAKPNLFIKKTQSFDKLFYLTEDQLNSKFNNGKLKRSCSCDSIFTPNQSQAISAPPVGGTAASGTVPGTVTDFGEKENLEVKKSRKRKRGRSFRNNGRVR